MWSSNDFRSLFFLGVLTLTIVLTVYAPGNTSDPYPWDYISSFFGWAYFFAWSVSFYFQLYLNHTRNSARGLSTDFVIYNLIGFSSYGVYTVTFYGDRAVNEDYKKTHDGHSKLVSLADAVFAVHAIVLSLITVLQVFLCLPQASRETVTCWCKTLSALLLLSITAVSLFAETLTFLNFLGLVKLGVAIIKYIPQVYMNYKNQSTVGWSIGNILLDATGGLFSFLQLIVDGVSTGNIRGITNNPAKLGLSFVAFFFDSCFIIQHYFLYQDTEKDGSESTSDSCKTEVEYKKLLEGDDHNEMKSIEGELEVEYSVHDSLESD